MGYFLVDYPFAVGIPVNVALGVNNPVIILSQMTIIALLLTPPDTTFSLIMVAMSSRSMVLASIFSPVYHLTIFSNILFNDLCPEALPPNLFKRSPSGRT